MLELLIAILVAVLICAAICLIAWGILAIIGLIPVMPPFIKSILTIVVWIIAGLACIVVLVSALRGGTLPLMLGLP